MARFELFEDDDNFLPDSFTIDCPVCGKEFEIPSDPEDDYVICPHCNKKIEIEST